ncbi:hypothetical protein OsJ_24182 [Oryza sativa Japonica Group]|uniref:Proteasome alpha-type subunits domain-containing protein n=1 Tax=Oryza sativa subsp. japonica TaxID=39947 RepID=A3BJK5_ORYSJ|nr:hypothetical protein OsJ_24182 [Oryza sativa Japonica Group]
MSRRYDSRMTIFSPEGRLYQVQYAMEAIGNAGSALCVLAADGVVLVGEKKVTSKLLQTSCSAEKMYKIDSHLACAVAGIMSDANILLNTARLHAQRYILSYQEPIPVEQLIQSLCHTKQGYTQFGGLRPFGVSFLFGRKEVHLLAFQEMINRKSIFTFSLLNGVASAALRECLRDNSTTFYSLTMK